MVKRTHAFAVVPFVTISHALVYKVFGGTGCFVLLVLACVAYVALLKTRPKDVEALTLSAIFVGSSLSVWVYVFGFRLADWFSG